MNKKTKVIPIFIPHKGCPHDCIFCNQKKISGTINTPTVEDINSIINESLKTIDRNNNKVIVAFYGGSFSAINIEDQKKYLEIVNKYYNNNLIDSIRISTRPDYLKIANVKLLKDYNVNHIEIGIQSLDNEVLRYSKRMYDYSIVEEAVCNIKNEGIKYGFQIMIGLPFDTTKKNINTCSQLLKLKPDTIRIYPVVIIKGTELEELYYGGKYTPLTVKQAVERSKIPYIIFDYNNITILRVGLHPSESLLFEGNIIDGPFHPSFGELLQSQIYLDMISNMLTQYNITNKNITIYANQKDHSKIVGNSKSNRKIIQKNFSVDFNIKSNNNLEKAFIIENDNKRILLSLKDHYKKELFKYKLYNNN